MADTDSRGASSGAIGGAIGASKIGEQAGWLFTAAGSPLPRNQNGASVYAIKWQWRAVGIMGAIFGVVESMWRWRDQHSRPDGVLIGLTVAFFTAGLWLASGSVSTDQSAIPKSSLWHSRSFQWKEITEIRLHRKKGGGH